MEPGKLEELKSALAPYMNKSIKEIKSMIQPKLQPALERKMNEDSEPHSLSYGMPAVNRPEIFNPFTFIAKLGLGTLAVTLLTGGINWVITHWPAILGGPGGGIGEHGLHVNAMIGLIAVAISILTGLIGLSLDD